MDPIALTLKDTAKAIGFGKTTAYRLIKEGRLKAVKICGRTLVTMASIKALLEEGENCCSSDQKGTSK